MNSRPVCHPALALTMLSTLAACATGAVRDAAGDAAITAADIADDVRVLSSDDFLGRLPGTEGGQRTVRFLVERFKALGLAPGNPDGTWVQDVSLVGITGHPKARFIAGGKKLSFRYRSEYVAVTSRFEPEVAIGRSPMVFVGYGIQAPEYDWDDYKGVDVRGKTLVMLVNDPPIPDPDEPSTLDRSMFNGKAMTFYGRWTYKYEIASKLGAAGVFVIHETGPAGYPWTVVRSSWHGEQFELANPDRNRSRVPVQGWLSLDSAKSLLEAAGEDFDTLKSRALDRNFKPIPLDADASVHIRNDVREVASQNVIARLPGRDPSVAHEHVIYTSHWDHLGQDPELEGDGIYNGALDNASGTAGLLALAKGFSALAVAPRRSMLFLAVTAEEQGLLGSRHYAQNPLYPLEKTLATINMDGLNPWGPSRDVQVIGMGQNSLEDLLAAEVGARGRVITPDSNPEKGYYYRSDQFEFAKVGVPSLYADGGSDIIGKPDGYGQQKRDEYTANDYHKPSDEMKDDWNLEGAAQDMRLLLSIGLQVANSDVWPTWKEGSEFKAIRESSLTPESD